MHAAHVQLATLQLYKTAWQAVAASAELAPLLPAEAVMAATAARDAEAAAAEQKRAAGARAPFEPPPRLGPGPPAPEPAPQGRLSALGFSPAPHLSRRQRRPRSCLRRHRAHLRRRPRR